MISDITGHAGLDHVWFGFLSDLFAPHSTASQDIAGHLKLSLPSANCGIENRATLRCSREYGMTPNHESKAVSPTRPISWREC